MLPEKPLKDLLVLEFASVLAGPSVGQFFAELGARVIKVENHLAGGDVTRSWRREEETGNVSAYFSCVNWGKQSIGIDLKSPAGRELAYSLIKKAGIVLTSFRPGSAERLGLDYNTVREIHPGIIYGSITGYGKESARVGYDAIIQAESGFMDLNGEPGSKPLKMPVALMDLLAGHHLKEALLLAYIHYIRTGEGSEVSISLYDAAMTSLANQAANVLVGKMEPKASGSLHPNIAPYGEIIPTADGRQVLLAIGNDRQFSGLCEILGISSLAKDPRYHRNKDRLQNRESLSAHILEAASKIHSEEFLIACREKGIPVGDIHSVAESVSHVSDKLILRSGEMMGIRNFPLFTNHELTPPPVLGADTSGVLISLAGISHDDYRTLAHEGIVA